jgi:hypothetical protein
MLERQQAATILCGHVLLPLLDCDASSMRDRVLHPASFQNIQIDISHVQVSRSSIHGVQMRCSSCLHGLCESWMGIVG